MILMRGEGASAGVAKGPLRFFEKPKRAVVKRERLDSAEEKLRLRRAQREAALQLRRLAERCRAQAGDSSAELFETHALLTEDEDYTERILGLIDAERCNAEYAVQRAGEQFAAMLAGMDDSYMKERAADIRDVSARLTDVLTGAQEGGVTTDEPIILAADELAPSETVRLDRSRILAIVTRAGSASSHTAILARTMGIPAVCGLGEALREEYEGRTTYVDGKSGEITLDPDARALAEFQEKYERQQERKRLLETLKGKEDVTADGRRVDVMCNVGSIEDVAAVVENDGRGIGLFRSEFLYLAARDYPSEEVQFRAYREAALAMKGKRVVIRTLDAGADKQAEYFHMDREENPALGRRGVRFCLSRPEIFKTQLRALYRASAYGAVSIMFPMIASVWEVKECRRMCREAMRELEREGVPFNEKTEIGVMIETPASALIADELAREADFFSVGTNDLTQYLLACDRQSGSMGEFFNPKHPAVLQAVRLAAEAAHRAGIWIGICGELATDAEMLVHFLDMGVDELSVSPSSVLPLRMEIRKSAAKGSQK